MDRHQELHDDNDLLRKRLDTLLAAFVGCKWADAGPLAWWKPEDEKYVTRESLIAAIDSEMKTL